MEKLKPRKIILFLFFASLFLQTTANNNNTNTNEALLCFRQLFLSSDFPFWKGVPKDKIHLYIDSEIDGVYLCKVYWDTEGTGTMGWIKFDSKCCIMYDITGDINTLPRVLHVDQNILEKLKTFDGLDTRFCPQKLPTLLSFNYDEWELFQQSPYEEELMNRDGWYHRYPIEDNIRLNHYYNSEVSTLNALSYYKLDCGGNNYECFLVGMINEFGAITQANLITINDKEVISEVIIGTIGDDTRQIFNIDRNLKVNLITQKVEYDYDGQVQKVLSSKKAGSYQIQRNGKIVKKK